MTAVVCFVRNYDGKLKLFGSLDFSLRRHGCVYKEACLTSCCNCFALLATYMCTHMHRWIQWTSVNIVSNHSMFHSCNIMTPKVRNRVWANSGCDLRQSPAKSGAPTGRALGGIAFWKMRCRQDETKAGSTVGLDSSAMQQLFLLLVLFFCLLGFHFYPRQCRNFLHEE